MFLDRIQEYFAVVRARGALLLFAALCLLMPGASAAQDAPKKNSETPSSKSSGLSGDKKPALAEATRVSTEDAARSVAQKQARKSAEEDGAEKTTGPDVLEFRPVSESSGSSGKSVVAPAEGSKKLPPGKVHGKVHGSVDAKGAATHREGASVGASSKSGKTAVYIETERGRTSQDQPH
jgi:hypothetical protein